MPICSVGHATAVNIDFFLANTQANEARRSSPQTYIGVKCRPYWYSTCAASRILSLSVHKKCGELLVKEKRLEEAAREYKVALELEPRDKDVLKKLCSIYIKLKDVDSAKTIITKIKRFHPDEDISDLEKEISEK